MNNKLQELINWFQHKFWFLFPKKKYSRIRRLHKQGKLIYFESSKGHLSELVKEFRTFEYSNKLTNNSDATDALLYMLLS